MQTSVPAWRDYQFVFLTTLHESSLISSVTAIPDVPQIDLINQYGSYGLSFPRIAFIDGSSDPWIGATPHSPHALPRKDTDSEPFYLIKKGVHHWDENGVKKGGEPKEIRKVHERELEFVKAWLGDWAKRGRWKMD